MDVAYMLEATTETAPVAVLTRVTMPGVHGGRLATIYGLGATVRVGIDMPTVIKTLEKVDYGRPTTITGLRNTTEHHLFNATYDTPH